MENRGRSNSDIDELSIALQQMQNNLQKVSEEHAERTWLQTGKNLLSERLRGEKSLPEVSKEIIDFLAGYIVVQIGTVYILESDQFVLQYAYGIKSNLTPSFPVGEGMVGQVALKKSLTVFDDVPKNYFQIKSSLGRQIPDSIVILPVVFNDKSIAVIELAKVGKFTPIQLKLLEEVAENIAISVNTSLNQESLKDLLEKLQLQKNDMEKTALELAKQVDCLNNAAIVSIADANGDIIYVNDKFCEISKYSREELIGQNHRIVKSGKQPDGLFVGMWKLISQGRVWNGEILNKAKDGSYYWVDTTITPFRGLDGRIEKYVAIRFDITAAKNQKNEIETITTELARQVDCLNNAAIVSIADDKGDIIYVNDKFCEISKYSREELMGQNHRLLKSGRQPDGLFVGMWKLISMGKVWNGEILNKAKDGSYYWVDTTITPFKGKDGRIEKYVAIRFDITNTKNQKNEIEAITTAIYKSNMAIEFDLNGIVLKSNDIFRNVMGYPDEAEIIGKHDSIFLEEGVKDQEEYQQLWQNLKKGEFQEFEYKRITKKGEIVWIKGNYNPIFDTQGKPYKILKIATDITLAKKQALDLELQAQMLQKQQEEMRRANEELDKKTKQLEISSKYKSEFLSNMSHELRTPLNSLLILSKDLADNKNNNLDKDQVESASIIYKSGQDLLMLINEVLDLSKIEAGKMILNVEPLYIKELCNSLRLNFKHQTDKKGISLHFAVNADVPAVIKTDALRLNQVLKNLLSNAIKFTDHGGISVNISLESKRNIRIDVKDSGIGIPKEKQMLIFEAFQQADGSTARKYGGTGLGLSISRDLIKLLEGELTLSSKPGEGSTFTVILPVELEAQADSDTGPHQSSSSITYKRIENNKRVLDSEVMVDDRHSIMPDDKIMLIIEDDPKFSAILRRQAVKKGFKCLLAATGEEGLVLVEKYKPNAIMLDIELPGISGRQVLAELKGNTAFRHIPVHIISAQDDATDTMKEGALEVSMKPVKKTDLERSFARIEQFLDRKIKNLLIVEDDEASRRAIRKLIEDEDLNCFEADTGSETIAIIERNEIDCMILDLGLPDMSGHELIQALKKIKNKKIPPIVIYTGRELNAAEVSSLRRYTNSIIIKGIKSEERLLDEASMFLHRIIGDLPPVKQEIIAKLYNKGVIFNNKKVLIVDDDMRNVFALSKKLRELGMRVEKADNGLTALEMLKKHTDFDIILMDIMMPEMDGYEAMKHIRAKGNYVDVPIIALTAKAMKEDEKKCLAAGANAYISKPVDLTALHTIMRVYMSRQNVSA
jgi:PAS domain S-box-containing protein